MVARGLRLAGMFALVGVTGGLTMALTHGTPIGNVVNTGERDATAAAVARLNAAINAKDLTALREALTDDCVFENTAPAPDGTRYTGKAEVLAFWERWFRNNADATFEVEEEFGAGDRYVVRWIYRKVHDGKPWHLRGVDVFRVRDGRVAEKLAYVKG
jgi:ketosteroid isomerase-like protein